MAVQAGFSQVAAALADPAREAIVVALLDGRALPAGELATAAGVSPQSASAHLQRLVECGLLAVWKQGKFRYYRLAGEAAAEVIENLPISRARQRRARRGAARHRPSSALPAAATTIWPVRWASSSVFSCSAAATSGCSGMKPR
jgi:DNA-binding transcriptional ArsR family regulator